MCYNNLYFVDAIDIKTSFCPEKSQEKESTCVIHSSKMTRRLIAKQNVFFLLAMIHVKCDVFNEKHVSGSL